MKVVNENGEWVFRSPAGISDRDKSFDKLLTRVSKAYKNASQAVKDEITKAFNNALGK